MESISSEPEKQEALNKELLLLLPQPSPTWSQKCEHAPKKPRPPFTLCP